jgi:hypothetical protein
MWRCRFPAEIYTASRVVGMSVFPEEGFMNITENKAERALRDRAFALADSGRFTAALEVERALISEGWPNARRTMESEVFRQAIHDRCEAAKAEG